MPKVVATDKMSDPIFGVSAPASFNHKASDLTAFKETLLKFFVANGITDLFPRETDGEVVLKFAMNDSRAFELDAILFCDERQILFGKKIPEGIGVCMSYSGEELGSSVWF